MTRPVFRKGGKFPFKKWREKGMFEGGLKCTEQ